MGFSDLFIDVTSLPQNGYGLVQLLFLGGVYGYILTYASNLISDGSELLLLVPSMAGLVGSVVLPVLGAVPDGCMVFFSGMGPNAQEQLTVGVGALAGSTIMLLTIPWFLSVMGGRVNIDPKSGRPRYRTPKLVPDGYCSLTETGVVITKPVNAAAYTILLTAISYFLLQIPGLIYLQNSKEEQAAGEKTWAIIGSIVCLFFFIRYLYQQYSESDEPNTTQQVTRDEILRNAIATKKITLAGIMTAELEEYHNRKTSQQQRSRSPSYDATMEEGISLRGGVNNNNNNATTTTSSYHNDISFNMSSSKKAMITEDFLLHLEKILKPFFYAYDPDSSGSLDIKELKVVFNDMGESLDDSELEALFKSFDTNNNGRIEYSEFVRGTANYICEHEKIMRKHMMTQRRTTRSVSAATLLLRQQQQSNEENAMLEEESHEDENEEEEMPEDIKDLSPEEQQKRIKMRAAYMMGLGTLLVLLISDQMVQVMDEIGKRTNIPGFYIAFVLAPLASNASELIAAYNYSQKKTATSITISLTTLEGACIMNNTFVLGIFMLLICTQNLAWEFFAETLTILFVQVIMACMALKKKHTIADACLILALYPLSLAMVALLESWGWD